MEEDMVEDKTSLAFGSGWTALGCIDPNNKKYYSYYSLSVFGLTNCLWCSKVPLSVR